MDGTVMIRKIMNEDFIIGMGSAFDFFPDDNIEDVPFNISIGDSFASDKAALCNDMNKIGNDFQVAIKKLSSKAIIDKS